MKKGHGAFTLTREQTARPQATSNGDPVPRGPHRKLAAGEEGAGGNAPTGGDNKEARLVLPGLEMVEGPSLRPQNLCLMQT